MWERNGSELEVAVYVRTARKAGEPNAPSGVRTLLLRQMEGLGVSEPGRLKNRWLISEARSEPVKASRRSASSKDRLQVIQGGG
jgi:hypothetical protein